MLLTAIGHVDAGIGTGDCRGTVADVEFGGALCTVTLSLAGMRGSAPLFVRSSSVGLPQIGSDVYVTVLGKAHVFDAAGG